MRDLLRELRPLRERVAVAGEELAPMAADVRSRYASAVERTELAALPVPQNASKESGGSRTGVARLESRCCK